MTFWESVAALGIALATSISWSVNQSILWAILQGGLGWFYVAYYVIWG
jgi:hypothetical protein